MEGGGGHRHLDGDGHRDAAAVDLAQLLAGDQHVGLVGAHPAVGLVVLEAEQADGAQLREELVRGEGSRSLPLVDVRGDLLRRRARAESCGTGGARRTRSLAEGTTRGRRSDGASLAHGLLHFGPVEATGPTGDPLVRFARDGAVGTITLDSPRNRNALSRRLMDELAAALAEVAADATVRTVVLTGTGPVFCSGADLSERGEPGGPGAALPAVLRALSELPQPVVARVNGHVRGGGIGLVAACDLAVAPSSATFAFSEVRVGVAPAMIAVPALAGHGPQGVRALRADRRALRRQSAEAAGLLTAVVDEDSLDSWVGAVVASVAKGSPVALAATKALPAALAGRDLLDAYAAMSALSAELFAGPDAAEGIAAFMEKRPPSWAVEK